MDYWPLILVALAVWFFPAVIAAYKGGMRWGVGWSIGLTGLGMFALGVPPLALGWLAALLIALVLPDVQH